MAVPTKRENSFTARNGGPTWPEDCFLSSCVQRRRGMAYPELTKGFLQLSQEAAMLCSENIMVLEPIYSTHTYPLTHLFSSCCLCPSSPHTPDSMHRVVKMLHIKISCSLVKVQLTPTLSSHVIWAQCWNPFTFPCPTLSAGAEPKSQGHCRKWHHKLKVVIYMHIIG